MKARYLISSVLAGVALASAAFTHLFSNAIALTFDSGYYIPAESSIFTFSPMVMNEGSGDWWLYGQDRRAYYAVTDEAHYSYLILPKARAGDNVDPYDQDTWGEHSSRHSLARED